MSYQSQKRRVRKLFLLLCMLSTFCVSLPAKAQQSEHSSIDQTIAIASGADGLHVQWRSNRNGAVISAAALDETLPRVRYQGYELPMQLLTVELLDGAELSQLQVEQVDFQIVASAAIEPAAPLLPAVLNDDGEFDLTIQTETQALPTAPAFVLRSGFIDGKAVAVIAISPVYQENGETRIASQISLFAPRMKRYDDTAAASVSSTDFLQSTAIPNVPPTNSAAGKKAAKIIVATAGMQRVPFSAITAAGLGTSSLGLTRNGTPVAIQIINNEIRFYAAPTLGDRWNGQEVYWLTADGSDTIAMASRKVAPGSATSRTQVFEKGIWRQTAEYVSRYAGPDDDHWFNNLMDESTGTPIVVQAKITSTLPAVGGTNYTLHLTPLTRTDEERRCTLQLSTGSQTQDIDINAMVSTPQGALLAETWSGTVTTTQSASDVSISLRHRVVPNNPSAPPAAPVCSAYFDTISWQRAVSLNFGGKSAAFSGVAGTWNYKWSNLPVGYGLFDVSDSHHPVVLTDHTTAGFQDNQGERDYILVGSDGFQTPQVVAHAPSKITSLTALDEIYIIAPGIDKLKNSKSLIQPLLTLRQTQGYKVAAIDVQDIYDNWSYGWVSPDAIRSFLQYLVTNSSPKLKAAVLVGDSTVDPKNWAAVPADKTNNINAIPAFMAQNIDPWIGEAACDNCFGQLNGSSPITGDVVGGNSFFDIDIWIGRFPVKNESDLSAVINKLVAYETATDVNATWRNSSVFLADNYVRSAISGQPVVYDAAGNFAKDADAQIARLLSPNFAQRIYYDPYPQYSGAKPGDSGRYSNPADVTPKIISTVNQGTGLVVYNGHANHWNMGNLERDVLENGKWVNRLADYNVLQLYDVDQYANKDKYFIQLSMTCLTAQFIKPASSGTTLDERAFLNPTGGAIALWGPAGLSVAHGHDKLQQGFIAALNKNGKLNTPIGQLIEAGMQELVLHGTCCQDALHTFNFFGDPLTRARTFIPTNVFLPLVSR